MKTKVVRIGFVALLAAGPVAMATAGTSAASTTTYTGKATFHPEGINACGGVSNVLITSAGRVKVLDFGVARAADPCAGADRLTQTGFIVGTPPYMAPEQARGHPEPGSDLYALGCLLFELITGRLPFRAPDSVGYLTAHLTHEPPVPSSVAPGIPTAWDSLVLTLLQKDPAARYRTAGDALQVLRQLGRAPGPTSPTVLAAPTATLPAGTPVRPGAQPQSRSTTVAAPATSHSGRVWKAAAARTAPVGVAWLLTVVAAVVVLRINADGGEDARDQATAALVISVATLGLVIRFVSAVVSGVNAREQGRGKE